MFSLSTISVSIHELPTSVTALVKSPVRLYVQPSVQGTVSELSRSFWLPKSSSEVGCQGKMWSLILGTTTVSHYPHQWPVVHHAFAKAILFHWDKPFLQLLLGEFFSIAGIEMRIHRAVVLRHVEHQDRGEDGICNQDIEGEAHEEQDELIPVSQEIGSIQFLDDLFPWYFAYLFQLPTCFRMSSKSCIFSVGFTILRPPHSKKGLKVTGQLIRRYQDRQQRRETGWTLSTTWIRESKRF